MARSRRAKAGSKRKSRTKAKAKRKPRSRTKAAKAGLLDPFDAPNGPDEKIGRALAAAMSRFGGRPEVTGIDVGYRWKNGRDTGKVAIRIHVVEKVPKVTLTRRETFPRSILGVPVDVLEARYEDHHAFDPARQTAVDPVRAGVSVGPLDGPTGTLGLLLRDTIDGRGLILGCAHVFAPTDDSRPGDPILQPGRADGGVPEDTIAALRRIDEGTDSAVAAAVGPRRFARGVVGGPARITGLRHPQLGDILEKSGRSTGVTRGRIDGMAPDFAGLRFVFRLVPLDGSLGPLCEGGDSGAVWYDPGTARAVGLHCKGGGIAGGGFALATRIIRVTERLGVELAP